MRARILLLLKDKPMNPNQLAAELGVNYRTITHHLNILEEHDLVNRLGEGYGKPYILSDHALEMWSLLEESINRVLGGGRE